MQGIVNDLWGGEGASFVDPCTPIYTQWYEPLEDLPEDVQEIFGYSPEKAREWIDEALGAGAELEFNVYIPGVYVDECLILQEYWKAVGLNANIVVMEDGALISYKRSEIFDGMSGYQHGGAGGYGEVLTRHSTDSTNWSGNDIETPVLDSMIEEMRLAMDYDQQWELYRGARNHYLRNPMRIRFPHPNSYSYWQPWVGGFGGEMGSWGDIYAHVWIDQAVKKAMGY